MFRVVYIYTTLQLTIAGLRSIFTSDKLHTHRTMTVTEMNNMLSYRGFTSDKLHTHRTMTVTEMNNMLSYRGETALQGAL